MPEPKKIRWVKYIGYKDIVCMGCVDRYMLFEIRRHPQQSSKFRLCTILPFPIERHDNCFDDIETGKKRAEEILKIFYKEITE